LLDSRYGEARGAHLCNSYTLALALRDPAYRDELNRGHLNFADGHYVAKVGRWRGQRDLTTRVYGPDIMLATMDRGREVGLRHYLYGASQETVTRLAESLRERFPGIEIVGIEAPPFRALREREEADLAERVARVKPDLFWVGTGTPRQDHFVARHTERLACTVVPVGAAFDFNSGVKRAAPRFIMRLGMEWLYRFAQEPKRLWRRYLIGIPVFIAGVLTDLFRRVPARPEPEPRIVPTGVDRGPLPQPRQPADRTPLVPDQATRHNGAAARGSAVPVSENR
jgi:N-acetylglucosaminyldiphosphoundecaprenol N-acetyl-beta-D-mannosaminyltransferase